MPKIINFEKSQREKRNGISDEEIQNMIRDMEYHMILLPNGDKACQKIINYTKDLLK